MTNRNPFSRRVDNIYGLTDVLSGKSQISGKVTKKKKLESDLEKDLSKGKTVRTKKFKAFDLWLERIEKINQQVNARKISIKRLIVTDPKDKNKIL